MESTLIDYILGGQTLIPRKDMGNNISLHYEIQNWRRLYNEELHNLCASPNIISVQVKDREMGGECSTNGRDAKCVQNFGRKPERKRLRGRLSSRWEDNIKTNDSVRKLLDTPSYNSSLLIGYSV
jgi:hypothetical protein